MGADRIRMRRMSKSPDDMRELLRSFIQERGLKVARWAKESAVAANSIYNFLNGHSEALDPRTYGKLARAAGVPIWRLTGEQPEAPSATTVWVVGFVEAGAFRDAIEWDRSRWYPVDVPVPERFQRKAKALEVRGPSMNLEYPEGSIVLWVDVLDARPPRHEDHVICYAYRHDDEIEATVKELRVVNGHRWLWPRSDDPGHQLPLDMDSPGDHIARVEIVGIVLGGYRPRVL
jgi:SOS-response transcriptional repressor LexA